MRNSSIRIAALLLLLLGGSGPLVAEDEKDPFAGGRHDPFGKSEQDLEPDPGPPRAVSVQVEFIEVSHEQVLDLLFSGEPPAADGTPLRKKLQGMLQAGQARLLETMLVSGRSGVQATVGSQPEWIYPSEFEPWEVPREIDPPGEPQRLTLEDRRGLEAMVAPATPTSFEIRNLGASLDVLPSVVEDRVYLQLEPTLAWATGRTLMVQRKDSAGNLTKAELPEIYRMQLRTKLSCPVGQQVLAGVLSPQDAKGATDPSRKIMVFVKCCVAGVHTTALSDVLVSAHVVEMSQELAAELGVSDASGDTLFRMSREFVKAGRAKLFETSVVRVASGERGELDSIQERIAPYEGGPSCTLFQADPAKNPAPPPPPPPQIRFPHLPTSFEIRNVGNSCEVSPSPHGHFVDVGGEWSFELYRGDSISEDWTDPLGNRFPRKMPLYTSFKADLDCTVAAGHWQLLSVQNSSDATGRIDPSRKLVVFVRADDLQLP
ncbi:hypothetical protein [Haloferula sp. BvORR071]|uniref:hypothetical protein n=1 Tax=Haloferula sp. BvORR071 TaxID=1396141 RepID=UPI002240EBE5|nr:hypothetical protein [Haloferula sp. BvORR071]